MRPQLQHAAAAALLALMLVLAGGSALRESPTVDEVPHLGAGLSYWQRLDLRLNSEHPPLAKLIAGAPLALIGTKADYRSPSWSIAETFFPAYLSQMVFGDAVLGRWNPWRSTLLWARAPMLLLTLLLGWLVYLYAGRLGGPWGALLCLSLYVSTPAFLTFGPLVLTDVPVTLFCLLALWELGELWRDPSRVTALHFGLAFGAALLAKFTGLLVFAVILALLVRSRFWPEAEAPAGKAERKSWVRRRARFIVRGSLWAALVVYLVYFVFSLRQPDDALNRIGTGAWAHLIRRPLLPVWLYVRGLLLMLLTGSRPTYLFGRTYQHGVPFYFPVVFALKSTLGFLLLLLLGGAVAILRRVAPNRTLVIPAAFRPHWRTLLTGFYVFLCVCLLSRLDISIRHFLMPIVLLILMLAPLPNLVSRMPARRVLQTAIIVLVVSSLATCLGAYPYFMPFSNSPAAGHRIYRLINDSNVSWNEALPAVAEFSARRHLSRLPLDWASMSDPVLIIPEAEPWDCQHPSHRDAGQWVVVAAVSLVENHSCWYLESYPHESIAGGSMYAFRLPDPLPAAGTPGGPPRESESKIMWGMPFDIRPFLLDVERHPSTLPEKLAGMMQRFQKPPASTPPPPRR